MHAGGTNSAVLMAEQFLWLCCCHQVEVWGTVLFFLNEARCQGSWMTLHSCRKYIFTVHLTFIYLLLIFALSTEFRCHEHNLSNSLLMQKSRLFKEQCTFAYLLCIFPFLLIFLLQEVADDLKKVLWKNDERGKYITHPRKSITGTAAALLFKLMTLAPCT